MPHYLPKAHGQLDSKLLNWTHVFLLILFSQPPIFFPRVDPVHNIHKALALTHRLPSRDSRGIEMHLLRGSLPVDTSGCVLTKANTHTHTHNLPHGFNRLTELRSRQFLFLAFPLQIKIISNTVNSLSPGLFLEGEGGRHKSTRDRGERSVANSCWPLDRFNWRRETC